MRVMEDTARAAGKLLRDAPGRRLSIEEKAPADFVTDVDRESERIVSEMLGGAYPEFGFLGEETGHTAPGRSSEWEWIVDPLDGTRNMIRGIPFYSLSIGLARNGEPVAGLIYEPLRDETFSAVKGGGAALNDNAIAVAGAMRLEDCVIGLDLGKSAGVYEQAYDILGRLMPRFQSVRMLGSMALGIAYVAAGRLDIYFNLKGSPWDIAAGIAIAREAGAVVTDLAGNEIAMPTDGLVAANPEMRRRFVDAIS